MLCGVAWCSALQRRQIGFLDACIQNRVAIESIHPSRPNASLRRPCVSFSLSAVLSRVSACPAAQACGGVTYLFGCWLAAVVFTLCSRCPASGPSACSHQLFCKIVRFLKNLFSEFHFKRIFLSDISVPIRSTHRTGSQSHEVTLAGRSTCHTDLQHTSANVCRHTFIFICK